MSTRSQTIRNSSIIAIIGNAILAVTKIFGGLYSGSLAVVGDGVDSCMDIVTSSIPYFTSKIIDKPADTQHPYGHNRAETIATKVLSLVIFFVGFQLLLSNIETLIKREPATLPSSIAIIVTLVSIAGKFILSRLQFRTGKKTESSMLLANAQNMQNDIITSCGVLVGLVSASFFNMPVLDQITAFVLSLFIMRSAYAIFMQTNNELMDGVDDIALYEEVYDLVKNVEGVHNPHKIRIRKLAVQYVIDLDIEVDGNLPVTIAHDIARTVEDAIRDNIKNVYDIIVHTEPIGNCEECECFGYSKI
jgi:cation diffusion facilitator family transporter